MVVDSSSVARLPHDALSHKRWIVEIVADLGRMGSKVVSDGRMSHNSGSKVRPLPKFLMASMLVVYVFGSPCGVVGMKRFKHCCLIHAYRCGCALPEGTSAAYRAYCWSLGWRVYTERGNRNVSLVAVERGVMVSE